MASSKAPFLVSGIYAVLCAPAIFLAEHYGGPQSFFHASQLLAVVICFLSSSAYLRRGRQPKQTSWLVLAAISALVSGLWLAFVVYVIASFDIGF